MTLSAALLVWCWLAVEVAILWGAAVHGLERNNPPAEKHGKKLPL